MENLRFKFRVWDKNEEQYYFISDKDYCSFNNEIIEATSDEFLNNTGGALNIDYFNNDNFIIEQSTGLRDKNGVLIYENDVLIDKYGKTAKIIFDKNAMFQCYVKNGDGKAMFYTSYSLEPNYIANSEVIGNIHQNKELLDD